jgi:hypothetical protein
MLRLEGRLGDRRTSGHHGASRDPRAGERVAPSHSQQHLAIPRPNELSTWAARRKLRRHAGTFCRRMRLPE